MRLAPADAARQDDEMVVGIDVEACFVSNDVQSVQLFFQKAAVIQQLPEAGGDGTRSLPGRKLLGGNRTNLLDEAPPAHSLRPSSPPSCDRSNRRARTIARLFHDQKLVAGY